MTDAGRGVVGAGSTDHILRLVQTALDEFDDRPLDVSVRRAIRIASLLGESRTAVRLALEVKVFGGDPEANAEDTRRLMADPETWGTGDSAAELALDEYLKDRAIKGTGKIAGHSLAEIQFWEDVRHEIIPGDLTGSQYEEALTSRLMLHHAKEIARHRTFTALCKWERQLAYASTNQMIFDRFQREVDALLASGAPAIIDRFNAVYRRLRDAAASHPDAEVTEELAHCVTSCRRILKAVVDHVQPPTAEPADTGALLGDAQYRNRLKEFLKRVPSETGRTAIAASEVGLDGRFTSLDKLANKGVHADVAAREVEYCAINTYIVTGEILRLAASLRSGFGDVEP